MVIFGVMELNTLDFNLFNSIILAGILQGLIFGLVVWANPKYRSAATLVLAGFIVSFSLDNLQYLLEDIGLISELQLYAFLFLPFELLSGPLFLLYGTVLMQPERAFIRRDWYYLFPFVLGLVVVTVQKIGFALDWWLAESFLDTEAALEFASILIDLSVLVYLTFRLFKQRKSTTLRPQLRWFKVVLVLLLILCVVWCGITIADYFYNTEYWYALYICMSAVIYWMGHVGIYQFGVEQERKKIRDVGMDDKTALTIEKHRSEHIAALEELLVTRRRFLDPTLTLDAVADELRISKSHLSRIINAELGMGFPDYLNALRVNEAKIYLRHPDYTNYTLYAIGLEAGFNSKTTYNTAFKKFTSMTPSAFRNKAT